VEGRVSAQAARVTDDPKARLDSVNDWHRTAAAIAARRIDSSLTLGVDGRGDCLPQLLLRSDREQVPFTGHALERVSAALLEIES
jgi:hypothetical protein